MQASLRHVNKE